MAKDKFILQFLSALLDFGGEMANVFLTTSYKGVRYKRKPHHNASKFKQGIYNLKRRGIIRRDGKQVSLTAKGHTWYKKTLLKYYRQLGVPWDGRWRVVLFDISDEKRNQRNIFRQKLKALGFYMLQKSVFVFPYPCESELGEICNRLRIGKYVNVILTDSLGFQDKDVRKFYSL